MDRRKEAFEHLSPEEREEFKEACRLFKHPNEWLVDREVIRPDKKITREKSDSILSRFLDKLEAQVVKGIKDTFQQRVPDKPLEEKANPQFNPTPFVSGKQRKRSLGRHQGSKDAEVTSSKRVTNRLNVDELKAETNEGQGRKLSDTPPRRNKLIVIPMPFISGMQGKGPLERNQTFEDSDVTSSETVTTRLNVDELKSETHEGQGKRVADKPPEEETISQFNPMSFVSGVQKKRSLERNQGSEDAYETSSETVTTGLNVDELKSETHEGQGRRVLDKPPEEETISRFNPTPFVSGMQRKRSLERNQGSEDAYETSSETVTTKLNVDELKVETHKGRGRRVSKEDGDQTSEHHKQSSAFNVDEIIFSSQSPNIGLDQHGNPLQGMVGNEIMKYQRIKESMAERDRERRRQLQEERNKRNQDFIDEYKEELKMEMPPDIRLRDTKDQVKLEEKFQEVKEIITTSNIFS